MKKIQASYTVEAAILIPIILFIIAFCINTAIDQYQEITAEIQETEQIKAPKAVEKVRFLMFLEKAAEELEWK